MKILILSQFCFPEPDFKGLPFAKELKKQGFEVEILTGYPNYPGGKVYAGYKIKGVTSEHIDGIKITRVPLYANHSQSGVKRVLNYFSFAFSAALFGPFYIKKPQLIYAYHAPATIAIPAIIIKAIYGSKIVYDINDYWPDTLASTGMLNNKTVLRLIGWYGKITYKFFDHINVVTPGFKEKLLKVGVPSKKISVIYNWSLPIGSEMCNLYKSELDEMNRSFSVVYAGNMGKAQALEVIIYAAKQLQDRAITSIKFVLIGDGVELVNLKELARSYNLNNVTFVPKVPGKSIGCFLQQASVLLLHLKKDPLFEITIPSKLAAYLMIGKPVLNGITGNAKDMVELSKSGYNFEPENAAELVEKTLLLYNMSVSELKLMGTNGVDFYKNHISFEKGTREFIEIFKSVA